VPLANFVLSLLQERKESFRLQPKEVTMQKGTRKRKKLKTRRVAKKKGGISTRLRVYTRSTGKKDGLLPAQAATWRRGMRRASISSNKRGGGDPR